MPKYPFSFKKYCIDIKGNNFEIQKGRATQLDAHWMQQSVEVSKGSHQKKTGKKVHNSCELSPKMENPPPPPISQQI